MSDVLALPQHRNEGEPTLTGRKRSQPTGGWDSSAGEGSDLTTRHISPSRVIVQGAAAAGAATAPVGGAGDRLETGKDLLSASGINTAVTDEIEHDVGESPVAFSVTAATKQDLGWSDSDTPAASVALPPAAVGTAASVDGSADCSSCLGDFNFSFEELNKMSKRYPTVNTLGARTPMPLLGWLTRELDMNHYDMRCLILRHPRLMAYRVTSHVAPKTKWLRERLGLGQAALRKLVTTYPAVLSRSVEKNLEPKCKWLEERLGASQEEVAVLIKRFPLIFGYSTTQNLEPTVAFFAADLSGEKEEIKSTIMSCPSILSRSLDKRMLPRARQMRAKEIEPRFGPHKWVVSTYTDTQFTRWLEGRGGQGKGGGVLV